MNTSVPTHSLGIFRSELALWAGAITTLLFLQYGDSWLADLSQAGWYFFLFSWLFVVMLWLAFSVVRHADSLAIILGEPYGTLILTLSVISIEVIMISAVMITGENNPTLARDMLYSVLMIVLNGLVGVTLIIGALRHGEQQYNLKGSVAYLGVIIPMAGKEDGNTGRSRHRRPRCAVGTGRILGRYPGARPRRCCSGEIHFGQQTAKDHEYRSGLCPLQIGRASCRERV